MQQIYDQYCIVRSHDQGVVFGKVEAVSGRCVSLTDARQIHGWEGANTLFEMSLRGITGSARISEPVPYILMLEACGIIPCQPEAVANLSESRWNASYSGSASRSAHTKSRPTR